MLIKKAEQCANKEMQSVAMFYVIGHEMTHGFDIDSTGANYNEVGDYENWWTDIDRQKYLAIICNGVHTLNNCRV